MSPQKNKRIVMIVKSKKTRKVIIKIKEVNKYNLNNKDIFINKLLGIAEEHITVDANKSDNLLLSSRLNVKSTKKLSRRYKNLRKLVSKIKSIKTKTNVLKLLRDTKYLRKLMNKKKKAINGNIRSVKKVVKIIGFNKGSFNISSKINEIKTLLKEKKSDIFIINELNLYKMMISICVL